jgi:NAD(P)-dependent dehydrogenase (short-subunit alcohol dehydrogenase family)
MSAHAMAPQIALVTGGNKGIGKEIVRKLAAMPGMTTVVLGRGLHSSTSQLNVSRVCHKAHPTHSLTPPDTP